MKLRQPADQERRATGRSWEETGTGTENPPPDPALHDLGAKLRHARRLKRLRLKDVAREVGCSESLLSKIECDKSTPSLRTLHRIVSVLDTSIASLFADRQGDSITLYRNGKRPVVTIGAPEEPGTIRLEIVTPNRDDQSLEANVHVVSPGATNGGEIKHVGEEMGYVIQGELVLTVGDTVHHLRTGDSFFFRSELPHSYRNPGDVEVRVLWVNTPPTF